MCVCVCLICLHRRNHLTATPRRVKFTSIFKLGFNGVYIKQIYFHDETASCLLKKTNWWVGPIV